MFNSSILDVIIGLVFCFASVALFVSSINEAVASFLKLRHKTLLTGIQKMLNDPTGNGLVKTLYEHALINPMSLAMPPAAAVIDPAASPPPAPAPGQRPPAQIVVKPTMPGWANREQLPAYIASKDFAHALIDIIRTVPQANADLKADIDKVADPQLRQALQGFFARAQGDVDKFSDAIANWFDNAMDRLSGSYKRRAQFWTFMIGLLTAAGLNIDAFYVLDQLWQRPELSAAIVSPASKHLIAAAASEGRQIQASDAPSTNATTTRTAPPTSAPDSSGAPKVKDDGAQQPGTLSPDALMKTLNTLPVGWSIQRTAPTGAFRQILFYLGWALGVAITASAAVFGAPFWFDLLQQLIQIRGTGAKPATNSDKKKPEVTSRATP
jgi:hypothetical protein